MRPLILLSAPTVDCGDQPTLRPEPGHAAAAAGPSHGQLDHRASAQARYQELLEAGAKIYEYQPAFMHAKYGLVDGKWSVIGSPNLNSRSRQLDEENTLGIDDAAFGATLKATFLKDLERSIPVDLEQWRRRNPLQRLFETVSRTLDQQS